MDSLAGLVDGSLRVTGAPTVARDESVANAPTDSQSGGSTDGFLLALQVVEFPVGLFGVPLPWWLLGVAAYPFLYLLGRYYVRRAEQHERLLRRAFHRLVE